MCVDNDIFSKARQAFNYKYQYFSVNYDINQNSI